MADADGRLELNLVSRAGLGVSRGGVGEGKGTRRRLDVGGLDRRSHHLSSAVRAVLELGSTHRSLRLAGSESPARLAGRLVHKRRGLADLLGGD